MEANGSNKTNGKYHQKHLTLSSGKRRLLGDVSTERRHFSLSCHTFHRSESVVIIEKKFNHIFMVLAIV